jgi:hypothetical protein
MLTIVSPFTQRAASEARYTAVMPMSQVAWALPRGISVMKDSSISLSDPALPANLLAPVIRQQHRPLPLMI